MKKIGIITFQRAHNYGASLQAYALQRILEKKDYDVKFINYIDKEIDKNYRIFRIYSGNIIIKLKSIISSIIYFDKNKKRYSNFESFINHKLKLTEKYKTLNELKNNSPQLDCYITGSDQVWNPDITNGLSDAYTLNFGSDKINRVSYAASIGKSSLGQEDYKTKLSRLNYISVREKTAKDLLEPVLNRSIEVVLDPTLLVSGGEWESYFNLKNNINEKYILAYRVENNEEYVKIVNELSRKTNLKVINFEKRDRHSYVNFMKSAYTEGPEEFVRLIKNAEYVVTTSFHATVFSILFHKRFFVVPHKTTGSRVTDLIDKLHIKNRIYYTIDEFKAYTNYKEEVDYTESDKNLLEEREKSINFLEEAIDGKKEDIHE